MVALAKQHKLTQTSLKELLDYNPETGIFIWKLSKGGLKAGDIAGGLQPDGYIRISIRRKTYLAHRLAIFYMTGKWPGIAVDHLNSIKSDNRYCNLEDVSIATNTRRQKSNSRNTSGHHNVCWSKMYKKWIVKFSKNRTTIHGGYFDNFEEACAKAKQMKNELTST